MEKQVFDVDALTKELDEEFAKEKPQEPAPEESEVEQENPETETEEETVEGDPAGFEEFDSDDEADEPQEDEETEPEVTDEEDEEVTEENPPAHLDEDLHKRNEAFKKLREERDQLAASDKFLSDLASQYGMTKEQLVEKYTQEMTAKQAKEAGITPEQYKKMQELEKKVADIEAEKNREVFNLKASQIADKYNLKEKDMMNLFSEAQRMGVDIIKNPSLLEVAYRAVNYDKAIEMGRQKQLETSKKRRATSVGKPRRGAQVTTSVEDIDREIDEFLKEKHIIK